MTSQQKIAHQYIRYLFLTIFILVIDFYTKQYAYYHWQETPLVLTSWLQFTTIFNRGISWGMLSGFNNTFVTVAIVVAILFVLYFLIRHMFEQVSYARTCLGEFLVLAGAFGNLIDRAIYPGVVDFILISYKQWHFPVFNIADISITLGIFLMFMALIKQKN